MRSWERTNLNAANRLLNCFENLDKWPKLSVALSKETWYVAPVDDTTRDAIRHLGKLTGGYKEGVNTVCVGMK